jgi:hypothetical protein
MLNLEKLLSVYAVAPVTTHNDLPPAHGLVFRSEPFSDDANVAITCENLLVVRKQVLNEDDRNELDDLFEGQPAIDSGDMVQYLATIEHFRVIPGGVISGRLYGCELRAEALAPGSVLVTAQGGIDRVTWRDPQCTVPRPASEALVKNLVACCKLPPDAWTALESFEK